MKKKLFLDGKTINNESEAIAGYKKNLNRIEAFFIMIFFFLKHPYHDSS